MFSFSDLWLLTFLAVGGFFAIFLGWPLLLAVIEALRKRSTLTKSKLCVGQVWHTRFHPKRHSFTYPIFMFALDLEEDFGDFMSPVVRFNADEHHLKNGEGKSSAGEKSGGSLAQRILRLVAEKTEQKFTPSLATHQIILLTHLEYFGYNFNPVSFYYIIRKESQVVEAMVGEVSNTPWTEMYCYVLHPDSIDRVQCKQDGSACDYRFPKEFHVSPFMEMNYWYDWRFQGFPKEDDNEFAVVNSLRLRAEEERMDFTAKLKLVAKPISPLAVAWQMIRFPVFCMLIQIWIHYQAAWLFIKGIAYVPHPQGSETAASKTIAAIMAPFFAIRDAVNPKSKTA